MILMCDLNHLLVILTHETSIFQTFQNGVIISLYSTSLYTFLHSCNQYLTPLFPHFDLNQEKLTISFQSEEHSALPEK